MAENGSSIGNLNGLVEKIGVGPAARGGAATVWRGQWVNSPRRGMVAIKVVLASNSIPPDVLARRLEREMRVWTQLSHKNILELCGSIIDPDQFGDLPALVAPWCTHGSLGDLLQANQGTLDRALRYNIIRDFTNGLHYMHTNRAGPVMHGDLKSANILIADEFVAKIGDFGLSRTVKKHNDIRTMTVAGPGTLRWMTPEASSKYTESGSSDPPNSATDIWAWGHLVYETVTGRMPYPQYPTDWLAVKAIMDGEINPRPAEDDLSTDAFLVSMFWSTLEKCWTFDPKERPKITEIIRTNPFISGSSRQNDDILLLHEDPASFNSALKYKKRADVAFRQQAYQEALDYYEKSRQLFERMGDQVRHAKALRDVAWTCIRLGNHINMARNCTIQAHEIFQKIGDIKGQLDAIQDLAIVERADRNLIQARNHLDNAYDGCRKAGLRIRSGWCLVAIGLLDVDVEDWEAAHRCFNAATEIARQERDQGLSGRSRERQGDCYMRQEMRPQARRCYDDAARAYRSLPKEEDQVDRVERKIQGCHDMRHQDINAMPLWGIGDLQTIDEASRSA